MDTIIVGGGAAGLAAALTLGRARRSVLVFDTGEPCNRFAKNAHNVPGADGLSPREINAADRACLRAYDNVLIRDVRVESVRIADGVFVVETHGGSSVAPTLILATGVTDMVPLRPGFRECWGSTLLHCPFCHGFEFADAATAVIVAPDEARSLVARLSAWTHQLTVCTDGQPLDADDEALFAAVGVAVEHSGIRSIEHRDGIMTAVVFDDGHRLPASVAYGRFPMVVTGPLPEECDVERTPLGTIAVDHFGATSVHGLFAAGDCASTGIRSITESRSSGQRAAYGVFHTLLEQARQ